MGLLHRIGDQRFCTPKALRKGDDAHLFQHALCRFHAVDVEGNHRTRTSRLLCIDLITRMRFQSSIIYFSDFLLLRQPSCDFVRIFLLPLHAHRQCLDAAHYQPAVEGGQTAAGRLCNQADFCCELFLCRADKTGDRVVMSAQELARAVNDDICTERNRVLQIWR